MWVERKGDDYTLSLREKGSRNRLLDRAVGQMAGLLDVPTSLLDRLRRIEGDKQEDCRLLNKLLWHAGVDEAAGFQVRVLDGKITEVFSAGYTTVHLPTLLREIEREEQTGSLVLARYEFGEVEGLRLVFQHPRLNRVALHHSRKTDSDVEWVAGAILTNREDGGHAVTVVPALTSPHGTRALPIVSRRSDVRRHRHHGSAPADLAKDLIGAVRGTAGAHYARAGKRFVSLNRLRVTDGEAASVLNGMNLPTLPQDIRETLIRSADGRNSSQYWMLMNLLEQVDRLPPAARVKIEIAAGRLVWARGKE